MLELLQAITTKFKTQTDGAYSSLYTAVNGQLYLDYVPVSATFPYLILTEVSQEHSVNFTDKRDSIRLQFSIYTEGTGALSILTIAQYLWDVFDECELTLDNNLSLISMTRDTCQLFTPEDLESKSYRLHTSDYLVEIINSGVRG